LVLITSLCLLQYQEINRLTAELEQLNTELEQLRTENGRLQSENAWLQASIWMTFGTLPTVQVTNKNYNESSLAPFWGCQEHKELSNISIIDGKETLIKFIYNAAYKAEVLNLNSTEIFQILENLTSTEMTVHNIMMLPCLIEKAKFKDADAWIIVFNWEIINWEKLGHIKIYVVECGTQTVLYSEGCY
jgi:regulator of replication initiation timing